jgi:hypothetical protein
VDGRAPASGTAVKPATLYGSYANPAIMPAREVSAKGAVTEGAVMSGAGMGARSGTARPREVNGIFVTSTGKGFLIASSARLRVEYARKRAELMIRIASRPAAGAS